MVAHERINVGFRHDINALRAMAVVGVMLFHLWPNLLPGGYKGVDVFFVISGFLITHQIVDNTHNEKIPITVFYRKRLFRIVPLMAFVIFTCLIVACFVDMPRDIVVLAKTSLYALAFAVNDFFQNNISYDYFSKDLQTLPLLHLWSLSIEGQFYLLWPLVLCLMVKLTARRYFTLGLVILLLCSVALSFYTDKISQSVSYYSFTVRCFEFIAGAVAFCVPALQTGRCVRNIMASCGLAIIVMSFFFDPTHVVFLSSFPAVLATFLILLANAQGTRLLALYAFPVIRLLGTLSFSLYLWHWPLITYYRYLFGELDYFAGCLIFLATVLLSFLSYRFIEQRFRSASQSGWTNLAALYALLIMTVATSLYLYRQEGIVNIDYNTYSRVVNRLSPNLLPAGNYDFNCQMADHFSPAMMESESCIIGDKTTSAKMVIIGDSNAAYFTGFLKVAGEKNHLAFRNITQSACPVLSAQLIDAVLIDKDRRKACHDYNDQIAVIVKDYDVIFWGQDWPQYNSENFADELRRKLDYFTRMNKEVIIALKIPRFPRFQNDCELKKVKVPSLACDKYSQQPPVVPEVNQKIKNVVRDYPNVFLFDPAEYVCDDKLCQAYKEGEMIYFDADHWSIAGSLWMGQWALKNNKLPFFLTPDFFKGKREAKKDETKMGWDELMSLMESKK